MVIRGEQQNVPGKLFVLHQLLPTAVETVSVEDFNWLISSVLYNS